MASVCVNPFDDNNLWNNAMASNILSKLPSDLVNHITDFIPQPKLKKSMDFQPGLYKAITNIERDSNNMMIKSQVLVPLINTEGVKLVIDTPKQFKIQQEGFKMRLGGFQKRKNYILKKEDFNEIENYKYYPGENILWIEKEVDVINIKILPWRDYYEDELNKLKFHI
jgi:hypothetical protein